MAVALFTLFAVSAAHAQARVTAEWDRNVDPYTVGYQVSIGLRSGSYTSQFDAGAQTRLALDLVQGQIYYLVVRGYNARSQFGPPSAEVVIDLTTTPEQPGGLRALVAGGQTTLQWNPPVGGGRPLEYLVSVGRSQGGSDVVNSYPVGAALSASGVLPPGEYFARVQAANLFGPGPASPDISFQVGSGLLGPSNLSFRWEGSNAVLSWAAPSGVAEDVPTSYVLEAGTAAGMANIASFNVGAVTSYTTSVPAGTYFVRVRGVNARGRSDPSNEIVVQGAQPPGAPTNLLASGTGSAVSLRWNAPAGPAVSGYVIEAGTAPGRSDIGVLNVGTLTSYSTTTVSPGVYYVRVRAVNASGASVPSNEIIVSR